jgi:mRNA interferase MazF
VRIPPVRCGDVYLVNLSPTVGSEIQRARPCVVVSPDELNDNLTTFVVAPMSNGSHSYPFRVSCRFHGRAGHVIVRRVDRERLLKRLGRLSPIVLSQTLRVLQEMFSP